MDVLNSAKGMIVDGVTEKAVLYVLNPATSKLTLSDVADAANEMMKTLKNGSIKDKSPDLFSKEGLKDLTGYGSKSSKNPVGDVAEEDSQKRWIKFKVQFNPETLRLYSANGRLQSMDRKDNGIGKLNIVNLSGKTKLSFELVFDDVDNIDAFMLENLTPNVGNVASKAGDMITHAGGDGHSVKKQMDAFLSLLSTFETQQVVFCWAKMSFRGTLTSVGNTFTMFNKYGNPVRGVMRLEITQEMTPTNELKYEDKMWDDAFYKRFTEGSVGAKSTAEKIMNNNVLNI